MRLISQSHLQTILRGLISEGLSQTIQMRLIFQGHLWAILTGLIQQGHSETIWTILISQRLLQTYQKTAGCGPDYVTAKSVTSIKYLHGTNQLFHCCGTHMNKIPYQSPFGSCWIRFMAVIFYQYQTYSSQILHWKFSICIRHEIRNACITHIIVNHVFKLRN